MRILLLIIFFLSESAVIAAAGTDPSTQPSTEVYRRLADETEANLRKEVLSKWFPAAMDEKNGGFFENFAEDWARQADQSRGIVYESRLTWTAAQAAERFPAQAKLYLAQTRHGLEFLSGKLWDQKNGGFFWAVDVDGKPTNAVDAKKQGYGNAFGIYAAAANYKATHDEAALDLAKRAFRWYDQRGHDAKNSGYLEIAEDSGGAAVDDSVNPIGVTAEQKSMNTSIHLLEAFTELYAVWPDPVVKARLAEMFEISREKIYSEPGYLIQFFNADWTPRPAEDSYGHDVEAAYLLVEAATALGIPDDPRTWSIGRRLVDHAMEFGVDHERGGLYNSGGISGGGYSSEREWWVQAEWLNALLLMHERYGAETPKYWDAFVSQWNWINQHQIDHVHGGWFPRVYNDGTPVRRGKSDEWTECYHQGRAMLNVSERLRKLADAK
jgi:cellobiose epimerase